MRKGLADDDESIISLFDSACVSFGDHDAIVYPSSDAICYLELQEYSKDVAAQLLHRFRPSYVLVDCLGHAAAEAVSLLACMRLGVEFVSVDTSEGGERLTNIVEELRKSKPDGNVVAIVCCDDDRDPILGVFAQADVHQILFMDKTGNLRERLNVLDTLPPLPNNDNLYVLFTSGTSNQIPKAVVGSHSSTLARLKWFRDTFEPSPRIGRRTKLTFVDGVTELLGALLFPPSQLVAVEPDELQKEGIGALLDADVTQLTLLPSQLLQVLLLPKERFACLERVICSGEPCTSALVDSFREILPNTTLINLYGQTETTGDVLYAVLTGMGDGVAVARNVVAVGQPILTSIQITCSKDGELMVQGNLSNGYLNANTKFEIFTTGDVGFCQGGIWYVHGRKDEVCKVNGVWTFPTEIESAFCKFYDMDNAVATILENQIYVLVDKPVPAFSRERMRESGLLWNLIPKQVIVHSSIPRKTTGAGKIDRLQVKQIVQDIVKGATIASDDRFDSLLTDVLKLSPNEIDSTKSFVELGGDSASAVTFLYQLRMHFDASLTAVDILHSDSLQELKAVVVDGSPLSKRQRVDQEMHRDFKPQKLLLFSAQHRAVQFQACVDAPPLLHQGSIFSVCQGGVVQRLNALDYTVEACHHFAGWMIQAGLIIHDGLLIVCAYTQHNKGMVAILSLDLQVIRLKQQFEDGPIKATPIVKDGFLWINVGQNVRSVSIKDSSLSGSPCQLLLSTATRPILHGQKLVYASSEYDTGLMIVDSDGSYEVRFSDIIGPVYKNPTQLADGSVLITDSYGSIHHVHLDENAGCAIRSHQVSNRPLTSPCIIQDCVIVGSYNSMVYCLDQSDLTVKWEFDAQAAIYASPLALSDTSIVVCTTAGDVIRLDTNGAQIWRRRIAGGEIWSDPIEVDSSRIAFGVRDSRLHILSRIDCYSNHNLSPSTVA